MSEIGVRRISVRRARWERWSGPVKCWFRNRWNNLWNWRERRRMRTDIRRWRSLTVPLEELEPDADPDVRRMAEMAELSGHSVALQYGYGAGEAVLVAHRQQPQRLRPFIDAACRFTLDQLLGDPLVHGVAEAVRARHMLLREVRDIVADDPKEPSAGT